MVSADRENDEVANLNIICVHEIKIFIYPMHLTLNVNIPCRRCRRH